MRRRSLVLVAIGVACASKHAGLAPGELALRQKLGIPADAEAGRRLRAERRTSTSTGSAPSTTTTRRSSPTSSSARARSSTPAARFYSVAEMAFLRHHLVDAHPEELAAMKADAARGALRIVGGGMTSPDTLLPETEMLLRDYLYGIQFAEDTLGAHPTAAWLPDSFGHGGAAPDVLVAAGFTSVAFSRLDGGPTIFGQLLHPNAASRPTRPRDHSPHLGSADFLWRGAGGATILAHYISGTGLYCRATTSTSLLIQWPKITFLFSKYLAINGTLM